MVLFLAGCGPYTAVGGKLAFSQQGFEVDLPQGWYQAREVGDALVTTRDGVLLQLIRVERVAVGDEPAHIKKKFTARMPAQDAANLEVENLRSSPDLFNFELLENETATIVGKPGFRLLYSFRTKDGLRLKRVHYGFVDGKWAYRLTYQAAARHYFDRDLATFERVRESFRLLSSAPHPGALPMHRLGRGDLIVPGVAA